MKGSLRLCTLGMEHNAVIIRHKVKGEEWKIWNASGQSVNKMLAFWVHKETRGWWKDAHNTLGAQRT